MGTKKKRMTNREKQERLEEQSRLLKLLCAVGDTVYVAMQFGGYAEAEVRDYSYSILYDCIVVTSDKFDRRSIPFWEFGRSVFLFNPEDNEKREQAIRRGLDVAIEMVKGGVTIN